MDYPNYKWMRPNTRLSKSSHCLLSLEEQKPWCTHLCISCHLSATFPTSLWKILASTIFPTRVPPSGISQQGQTHQQLHFPYPPSYFYPWAGCENSYQPYLNTLPHTSMSATSAWSLTNTALTPPILATVFLSEDRFKKTKEDIVLLAKKKDAGESNVIK